MTERIRGQQTEFTSGAPARRRSGARPLLELLRDLLSQTAGNIRRNKLRSFLTLFGIAWGIASLVLLSALTEGFRAGQRKSMLQLGNNIIILFPGRTEMQAGGKRAGRPIFLNESDIPLIRQECPAVDLVAGEHKTENVPVRSATNAGRFLTLGVTPEYLHLRNLWLAEGRHPSAGDLKQRRRVAVLGNSVREQLFGQRTDVIGETIRIRGYPYRVIGYMSAKNQNSSYDGWDNDKIIVPATTLTRDAPADRHAYRDGRLATIVYRPVSADRWAEAQAQVKAALGRAHGFDPKDKSAIGIWDTVEAAELFDRVFDSMEIFLSVIALVTMSLGGVGVMNMMMMAVTERTNEIGLKKALGATRRRILLEFFLDGVALALLAGFAGLLLVLALSALVNSLPLPAMFAGLPIGWSNLLAAAVALGTVAIASALPPAYRAAKLTPVEALRYEK